MRLIKLTHVDFRAHVKIASRIVSYRKYRDGTSRPAKKPPDSVVTVQSIFVDVPNSATTERNRSPLLNSISGGCCENVD